MDAAALEAVREVARIVRGEGGNRKVRELSKTDPDAWRDWRKHFSTVATLNGWDNRRQRLEIAASMDGAAQRRVAHIPHEAGDAGAAVPPAPADALLDAYEACFMPAQAGQLAQMNFDSARQEEDETVTAWHGRLRGFAARAFPDQANDLENFVLLKRKFLQGLANTQIAREASDTNPATYQDALNVALQRTASLAIKNATDKGQIAQASNLEKHLFAMEPAGDHNQLAAATVNPGGKKCYFCDSAYHYRRDCPKERQQGNRGNRKGRGGRGGGRGGRGGRGGGKGRRGKGANNQAQGGGGRRAAIASLAEAAQSLLAAEEEGQDTTAQENC